MTHGQKQLTRWHPILPDDDDVRRRKVKGRCGIIALCDGSCTVTWPACLASTALLAAGEERRGANNWKRHMKSRSDPTPVSRSTVFWLYCSHKILLQTMAWNWLSTPGEGTWEHCGYCEKCSKPINDSALHLILLSCSFLPILKVYVPPNCHCGRRQWSNEAIFSLLYQLLILTALAHLWPLQRWLLLFCRARDGRLLPLLLIG